MPSDALRDALIAELYAEEVQRGDPSVVVTSRTGRRYQQTREQAEAIRTAGQVLRVRKGSIEWAGDGDVPETYEEQYADGILAFDPDDREPVCPYAGSSAAVAWWHGYYWAANRHHRPETIDAL